MYYAVRKAADGQVITAASNRTIKALHRRLQTLGFEYDTLSYYRSASGKEFNVVGQIGLRKYRNIEYNEGNLNKEESEINNFFEKNKQFFCRKAQKFMLFKKVCCLVGVIYFLYYGVAPFIEKTVRGKVEPAIEHLRNAQ